MLLNKNKTKNNITKKIKDKFNVIHKITCLNIHYQYFKVWFKTKGFYAVKTKKRKYNAPYD